MDLRGFTSRAQRHRCVRGEEGDDVHIVREVGCILRQGQAVMPAVDLSRLQAVDEEDVFVLRRDGEFLGDAGLEAADEGLGHGEECRVIQSAVGAVVLRLRVSVEAAQRSHVAAFAEVVPGDQLDEVGLKGQQVQPAVKPHGRVLRVQPVQVRIHALEEPRRDACHPGPAGDFTFVGEVPVDGCFLLGIGSRMDPGEVPRAHVCGGDGLGGLRDITRHEHYRGINLIENILLPIERRRTGGEGAKEDFAIHPELSRMVGVGVGDVDHHMGITHDGGVVRHEELELLRCSVRVESVEEAGELHPVDAPAAIVDGEGIDAGSFGKGDVVGVAAIRGLKGDHIVCEDQRVGVAARRSFVMAVMLMHVMSCRHD